MQIRKKNNDFGAYLLTLLLIIFSSQANDVVYNNYFYPVIPTIIAAFIFFKRGNKFTKEFLIIILFYTIFIFLSSISVGEFHPGFAFRILNLILFSYLSLKIISISFIYYFEKILFQLTIVGLFLFGIQLFAFKPLFQVLSNFQNNIGLTTPTYDGLFYTNIWIYTINTTDFHRNCSYMFEPGAYACTLSFAIAFNLILNNFKLNSRILVFVIAMISTQSTTGFINLLVIIAFYQYNKMLDKRRSLLLIPVFLGLSFFIMQLPFMIDKITVLTEDVGSQTKTAYEYAKFTDKTQSLGRFAGIISNIEEFKKNPILGVGGHLEEMDRGAQSVNGLGNYLVIFGILAFVIMIISNYFTFKKIEEQYYFKGSIFLFIIFLVIGFSFNMLQTALFFSFQIYSYLFISKMNNKKIL